VIKHGPVAQTSPSGHDGKDGGGRAGGGGGAGGVAGGDGGGDGAPNLISAPW